MKRELFDNISMFLLRHGFTIRSLTHTCFDILARKDDRILLIKILEDANSINKDYAIEMKKLSDYLSASPIIIAHKAGAIIHDNVVYSRFGIFCLNPSTFRLSIQNKLPFIYSGKAGLTAVVNGEQIKRQREKEGYSLSTLSKKIGVSKSMIQKYEKDSAKVTITNAVKMHDIFGDCVFEKINIFSSSKDSGSDTELLKTDIGRKFDNLGFRAAETKKVPFDVIAKKEKEIILTDIGDKKNKELNPISHLLKAKQLVIYKKQRPRKIPALTKSEFLDFRKAYDLLKFIKEFDE